MSNRGVRSSERQSSRVAFGLRHARGVILNFQAETGAYPASPTFSAYRGYSWFRDGSFIADAMSVAREVESASAFHDWCSHVVIERESQIRRIVEQADSGTPVPASQMLPTRFTLEGQEGTDDWWDFQLDGYGTWLWAVVEHARRHSLPTDLWQEAASLVASYLISSWKRPCFDWWEEHAEQVHVSTLGCVAAGLRAVISAGWLTEELHEEAQNAYGNVMDVITSQGVENGHLTKWLGSAEVDASLSALIAPLKVIPADSALARRTVEEIDKQLQFEGGVHRFRADKFFGGGRWPLLSCFLGLAEYECGNKRRAAELFGWALAQMDDSGDLIEQVDGHLLDEEHREYWIKRWGTPALPLLWSHAMLLRLAADLNGETLGLRGEQE